MTKWKKKQNAKSLATEKTESKVYIIQNIVMCYVYKSLMATPQPSVQSDPISSEISGSTDSIIERVPAIVGELIDLVAAIGLPVDVHKCMTKASLQLQCDPKNHRYTSPDVLGQ